MLLPLLPCTHYVTPIVKSLGHYLGEAPKIVLSRTSVPPVDSSAPSPLVVTVVPRQPQPSAVNRTVQSRAQTPMQSIYTSIMTLFPKKPVTVLVAGLPLTNDKAKILVNVCQTLERLLIRQTAEIEAFPNTDRNESFRALCHIQERHNCVTNQLKDLIYGVGSSTEPWLQELGDAKKTMERKVKCCNHASKPMAMGWKEAGNKYWPLINETYTALFDLLESLKQELEDALKDEALWTEEGKKEAKKLVRRSGSVKSAKQATPKPSMDGKRVKFHKSVQGRYFYRTETIRSPEDGKRLQKSKELTEPLTNDQKHTTTKFKHRAVLQRKSNREQAQEDQEDPEKEAEAEARFEAEARRAAQAQALMPF
jgi:hypothetical protein